MKRLEFNFQAEFVPSPGTAFVTPIDHIPAPSKQSSGFGVNNDRREGSETPYKFQVVSVGSAKRTVHGVILPPPMKKNDIISISRTNSAIRKEREESGFTVDGTWLYPIDFDDFLGTWDL